MDSKRTLALLGMPNCGKSTLYHELTGRHVPTGNRAGVTVGAASAPLRRSVCPIPAELTDLPGIRSIPASSPDEAEALRVLRERRFDLLLLVVDATLLGEQLPSLLRMLRTLFAGGKCPPVVVVLNCCDELERFPSGRELTSALGFSCVPVSARTGDGLGALSREINTRLQKSGGCSACRLQNGCFWRLPDDPDAAAERAVLLTGGVSLARQARSDRLDRVFLRPATGFPLFFLVMAGVLFSVFGAPGTALTGWLERALLAPLSAGVMRAVSSAPAWLRSMVGNGILGGVGAVFGFLPRLLILFFFQTGMEQSGFLARVSRLWDPVMRKFGLRGDAVTPALLGFGCTVPAILSTRGMKDEKARERCACFLPSIACSARMPLCLLFSDAFFPGFGWLVCASVWVLGGAGFLCFCALCAKAERGSGLPTCHSDALPRWRIPGVGEVLTVLCEQIRHFFTRAGGLIFLTSVGVWLLSSVRFGQAGIVPVGESALASLGRLLSPLFAPLGFGNWQTVAALLIGIGAKEAALSTLGVLLGGEGVPLAAVLRETGMFSPASAISFLIFYTFYFPCAATMSVLRAEKAPLRRLLVPLGAAYLLSFLAFTLLSAVL